MPSMECEQEFEVLESIYKEIEIVPETANGASLVSILLYPKSAGDMESRYVTVKLELHLPPTYPTATPIFEIRNPRGLSEEQLQDLENNLRITRENCAGSPMLFQLIDLVQEYLTMNNRPSAECPICLMGFTEFDVFYTPACFHHYHSHCLGLHLHNLVNGKKESMDSQVSSSAAEILCPVCRIALDPEIDIEKLLASPPASEEDIIALPIEVSGDRDKLDALFQKQKEQGGIIDLNEDCVRLLRISDHEVQISPEGDEVTGSDQQRRTREPERSHTNVNSGLQHQRGGGGRHDSGYGHSVGKAKGYHGHHRSFRGGTAPHSGRDGHYHHRHRDNGFRIRHEVACTGLSKQSGAKGVTPSPPVSGEGIERGEGRTGAAPVHGPGHSASRRRHQK